MNRVLSQFPRHLERFTLLKCRQLSTIESIKSKSCILPFLTKPTSLVSVVPQRFCATNVSSHSENHTPVWNAERLLSAGLIGVMPLSFMIKSPVMDYALALAMVLHIHWGIEAVVVDYIRPRVFGAIVPKLALVSVYALSIATLAGLFYFNYTDVGVVQGIRMTMKM